MLKKLCAYPGCNTAIPINGSYCPRHSEHAKIQLAAGRCHYDRTVRLVRDADLHAFYISRDWGITTAFILDKYKGLCLWSYFEYKNSEAADSVHHILPLRTHWDKRLDISHLIPLTHPVHMMVESAYRKGEEQKKRMQNRLYGLLFEWSDMFETG